MSTFEHSDYCVGIDLGTTNSAIATCAVRDGKIKSVVTKTRRIVDAYSGRDETEQYAVLPSCVYYRKGTDNEYTPIVGNFARRYANVRPELVAKSIKLQMGETKIVYPEWDENIPDKRPEDVSARILDHLIKDCKRQKRTDTLEDVVIAVPASSSHAQRHATLLAAEKAGINVRDENGNFRDDILLSEPEAVMYQLINDIQNGDDDIEIDFDEKKNVMIFDIGGGTLDITVHEVQKLEGSNIISLKCLGTDKYTPIAGDAFDSLLVDYIYDAYISYWERQSEDIAKMLKKDTSLKSKLLKVAEDLKISVSESYSDSPDELYNFDVNLNNGYVWDGDITKEEFEECLTPLMGHGLVYNDYKNVESITDKNNIIYPVLCVLKQVADKIGDDFKIDAVVLNGGMSRLYMINDRLTEFFGFKTLPVSDPDLSVAKGASIWHYYLHQQKDCERMNRLHFEYKQDDDATAFAEDIKAEGNVAAYQGNSFATNVIVSDNAILPEAIYFGLKGGVTQLIAADGAELPLTSTSVKGKIAENQKELYISILQKQDENSYKQISSGIIKLRKNYYKDVFATLRCNISKEQIITIEADISGDECGMNLLERSDSAEIILGEINENGKGIKLIPPEGSVLNVKNEMQTFITLCNNLNKAKKENNKLKKLDYPKKLAELSEIIKSAGNPCAFADDIIKTLSEAKNNEILYNLLPIASSLGVSWEAEDKARLIKAVKRILDSAKLKYDFAIPDEQYIYIINKAIQLIGNIGNKDNAKIIEFFASKPKHKAYVLCAYSNLGVSYETIYDEFMRFKYSDGFAYGIFWAIGNCFKRTSQADYKISDFDMVSKLIEHIQSGNLNAKELVCAETSLGLICDQRDGAYNSVYQKLVDMALNALATISDYYSDEIILFQTKTNDIARMLIEGVNLSAEDSFILDRYSTNLLFDNEN